MTTRPKTVRQSDLINQLVLDCNTMEELGRVEVLWMYPPAHRVLGFVCKSGLLGAKKSAFKLEQIHALGENGVLTNSPPEPTDADRVSKLESLFQHEVWSDGGNRIGKITDCLFNLRTGRITHYLFISNGWAGITGELYQLPTKQILSFGQKRVLVSEATIDQFPLYQEGIRQKLTEVSEILKEEATQEWRSLTKRAKVVTAETRERLQDLTEQAKERAQRLSQDAKKQVETLNQLQENPPSWVERLKEKGQTVAKQLRQQTQNLSKHMEDGIETVIVQEEIFDVSREKPEQPEKSDKLDNDPSPNNSFPQDASQSPQPSPPASPGSNSPAVEDDDDEPWI